MECEKCGNYKLPLHEDKPVVRKDCLNYKPKRHPLDALIDNIMEHAGKLGDFTPIKLGTTYKLLNKLRYESIKHGNAYGYCNLEKGLKKKGYKHWIVND